MLEISAYKPRLVGGARWLSVFESKVRIGWWCGPDLAIDYPIRQLLHLSCGLSEGLISTNLGNLMRKFEADDLGHRELIYKQSILIEQLLLGGRVHYKFV